MPVNYQLEMENLIKTISTEERRPRLLLHACCAPCSSAVLERVAPFFDVTIFWYNPNIYPEAEEKKRLAEFPKLLKGAGLETVNIITPEYVHDEYLAAARGFGNEPEGGARCGECFMLRLGKTAEKAKELGFDFFGTTLTVSPHKNAQLINEIGYGLEGGYGVKWLPSDFKKQNGYLRSIELSKEFGLYRQDYCGCEFAFRGE